VDAAPPGPLSDPLPYLSSDSLTKLAAARLRVVYHHPYMASALFACPVLAMPTLPHGWGAAITQDWQLLFDPQYVEVVSVEALSADLLHLVSHVLRGHAERANALSVNDQNTLHQWVVSADTEIIDDFVELVECDTPIGRRLYPNETGQLAESYYATDTADQVSDNPMATSNAYESQWNCGSGAHGNTNHDPDAAAKLQQNQDRSPPLTPTQQQLLRRRVAEDAARHGSGASSALRAWAGELLTPTVDWRRELRTVIRRTAAEVAGQVDYSYRRPSRRTTAVDNVVLPRLMQRTTNVAIVCDTSASVSDEQLARAASEVNGILQSSGPRQVTVFSCDDQVQHVAPLARGKAATLLGGGGTDMGVGIRAATRQRPRPDLLVVFTDGYTPWPESAPPVGVVVALLRAPEGVAPPPSPPAWAATVSVPSW